MSLAARFAEFCALQKESIVLLSTSKEARENLFRESGGSFDEAEAEFFWRRKHAVKLSESELEAEERIWGLLSTTSKDAANVETRNMQPAAVRALVAAILAAFKKHLIPMFENRMALQALLVRYGSSEEFSSADDNKAVKHLLATLEAETVAPVCKQLKQELNSLTKKIKTVPAQYDTIPGMDAPYFAFDESFEGTSPRDARRVPVRSCTARAAIQSTPVHVRRSLFADALRAAVQS